MNSRTSLTRRLGTNLNKLAVFLLIVALFGFADATYLSVKHYSGTPLACSIFEGCEKVTSSRYAVIAGIPLALGGAIYYFVVIILTVAYLDTRKMAVLLMTARLTVVGFLASAWFVYLQLFVIRAICPYCMLSAIASTALFGLGSLVVYSARAGRPEDRSSQRPGRPPF
jgi:uncharacterized membrane protein